MTEERSDEELAAGERLMEETRRHLEGHAPGAGLTDALLDLLRTRGAREGIDAERHKALEAVIQAFGGAIADPVEAPDPVPDPTSDDLFEKLGMKRPEQLRKELAALQERTQAMRQALQSMLPLAGNIQRPTRLPEAAAVLHRLNGALSEMLQESARPGGVSTSRFHQPTIQLGNVHRDLQSVDSTNGLNRIREDRLYPNLMRTREIILEGHAMLAWPKMGNITSRTNANTVQLLGPGPPALALATERVGLHVARPRTGADEALNRWQEMLESYVVVANYARSSGSERASIEYQIGWAQTLGRPLVILAERGQSLPFNLDIEPTPIDDADAIEAALLDALFLPPRSQIDRSASMRTVERVLELYGGHPSVYVKQSLQLLTRNIEAADDGDIISRLRTLVSLIPEPGRPHLITPRWPPDYPRAQTTTMFHVMPFREGWSNTARCGAQEGASDAYRRHDDANSDHVIRSLWGEISRASHVLVDITGVNPNVMIELGMAHALGKRTQIVVQDHVDLDGLHSVIRFWRVKPYKTERSSTLAAIVREFLSESPST